MNIIIIIIAATQIIEITYSFVDISQVIRANNPLVQRVRWLWECYYILKFSINDIFFMTIRYSIQCPNVFK